MPSACACRSPGAEPDEDDEAQEEQGREEDAEEEEQEENAAPLVPRPRNTRTIKIERFVPASEVDLRYLEKPYYVVPRDAIGQEAFAVIRDAMSREAVLARTPDACRGKELQNVGDGVGPHAPSATTRQFRRPRRYRRPPFRRRCSASATEKSATKTKTMESVVIA